MMYDLSRTERRHRAINAERTTSALIRKRCTCGEAATAKQLDQHGKCVRDFPATNTWSTAATSKCSNS
jgi:hypothetical protein